MITAGIDAGSRTIKVVLFDADRREIVASGISDQGVDQAGIARRLFEDARAKAGTGPTCVIATGYGRYSVDFADRAVTEITCHSRGVRHVAPSARTIIDIGGQDSKLIRLDANGVVQDFQMNDRCAAGTGRFLEVVADRLDLDIADLGRVACDSREPAAISSMCVVFAETEIIGLLASGVPPGDIVAGVQKAIVTRVASMAGRGVEGPIVFTGGVALVGGMREAFEKSLKQKVTVAPAPQMTGALGAALIAADGISPASERAFEAAVAPDRAKCRGGTVRPAKTVD